MKWRYFNLGKYSSSML